MLTINLKISVFLLLIVLVNITNGETTTESVTPHEQNGNTVITESVNLIGGESGLDFTTPAEGGSGLTPESNTEAVSEESNNDEVNITEANTESVTETSTNEADCICDCVVNGKKVIVGCKTQAPEQTQTETTESGEGTTVYSNNGKDAETTTLASVGEQTTEQSNVEVDTTTQTASEPEITTVTPPPPPPPVCHTPGVQAHESNCQQYYDCSLEGSQDGNFHLLTKFCPEKQAFNSELNRCSRDISSCSSLPIQCLIKGTLADPASNTSFYLCEPRIIGLGFRIFHIECAANEIFYPELGKCYVDFNNLPTENFPLYNWNQITDIDIVKAELKLLKAQDKLKLKQEKAKQKAEEKLQKQLEKEAKKKAKEQEKINKEKAKQQAATFTCVQEGNYASEIGENVYYACVSKKGKLKAIGMQCSFGATFNPETGSCINNSTNISSSISKEDDD
ncbi:mucin related 18B [Cochliomyia hominivorax]